MRRWLDLRRGEVGGQLAGLAALLLLIIAAHTILETARDALLLTGPGPRALGLAYMAIAAGTVPGAAAAAIAGRFLGQRTALLVVLLAALLAPVVLFFLPPTHATALATYVVSGVLGSIVVPQFWTYVASVLTVGQGRRLLGLIATAGVLGGVLGPTAASWVLVHWPTKALLLLSAGVFACGLGTLSILRGTERAPLDSEAPPTRRDTRGSALRDSPFLTRVALLVFFSTATFLALDFLFKSSVVREVPRAEVGRFIAHYYLALNLLSLVVQLAGGAIIRRLGVLPGLVPTPLLLFVGTLLTLATGGGLLPVLLVKAVDGSTRYSIHRVTSELLYLPVPADVRQRTKPFIDGTLARVAQAATGATLLALGAVGLAGARPVSALVAALALVWLVTVLSIRHPYLRLLREAISSGSLDPSESDDPVDHESAQALLGCLAIGEPHIVVGALRALARRGSIDLVPALILLHPNAAVLEQALDALGASTRTDWFSGAEKLLDDPRETVCEASARALCRHDRLDSSRLAGKLGWRTRGYAAVRSALAAGSASPILAHPALASLLGETGEEGHAARLGILSAIADASVTPRLSPLLRRLGGTTAIGDRENAALAQAAARQKDASLIPHLVQSLAVRDGREAVRAALVALGEPALHELLRALHDPASPRRLRVHVPKTLARFHSARAADLLMGLIETEVDGLVRYKAIRSLRVLIVDHRLSVDRLRAERAAHDELVRHFARLAERLALSTDGETQPATTALLLDLLAAKADHALERAYQLLQIGHPRQGVHRAYVARRSSDPFARANAAELLDALLIRRDQRLLRALFRIASDELPVSERIARARPLVPPMAVTRADAQRDIAGERDAILAALARRMPRDGAATEATCAA